MTNVHDEDQAMNYKDFISFLKADAEQFADELENGNIDPDGKLQHIWIKDIGDTVLWDDKTHDIYIYNRLFKFAKSTDPNKAQLYVDTNSPILLFDDTPQLEAIEQMLLAPTHIIMLDPDEDYYYINYLYDLVAIFVFFYRKSESIDEAINEFMRTIQLCKERAKEHDVYLATEMTNYLYEEIYLEETAETEGGE